MGDLKTKIVEAFEKTYGKLNEVDSGQLVEHAIASANKSCLAKTQEGREAYNHLVEEIHQELNRRKLVQDQQPQEHTISTIPPTSINESMLNVNAKNEIPEILLEQQNVERDIQTDPEVKDVVEKEMQSVEQQVKQMPDQRDDELETLRAQVEQLKTEKQAVQQQPGEVKKPPFNRPLEWLTPGGLIMGTVHGVGSLVKKIFGK